MEGIRARTAAKVFVWAILFGAACWVEFGVVFLLVSGLAFMWTNVSHTGRGEGELSAYAAFNKGGAKMAGSMDASQFEAELRHQAPRSHGGGAGLGAAPGLSAPSSSNVMPPRTLSNRARKSKKDNKRCACGSGKKFKNCCSVFRKPTKEEVAREQEAYEQWERDWT